MPKAEACSSEYNSEASECTAYWPGNKSESSETFTVDSNVCAAIPVDVPSFQKPTAAPPIHLQCVRGYDHRINDIIYSPPWSEEVKNEDLMNSKKLVIFFGGDIQDLPKRMVKVDYGTGFHGIKFEDIFKWNLENTASLLQSQFQNHHILVIRPTKMADGLSACYHNFVNSSKDIYGIPKYSPMHFGLFHLEKLLQEFSKRFADRLLLEEDQKLTAMPEQKKSFEEHTEKNIIKEINRNEVKGKGKMEEEMKSASLNVDDTKANPHLHRIDQIEKTLTAMMKGNWKGKPEQAANFVNKELLKMDCTMKFCSKLDLDDERIKYRFDLCEIKLVGFSKGCVVLNQLLYEINYLKKTAPEENYFKTVNRIKDMYWLDPGHAGEKGAWVTSPNILKSMAQQGISAHVHVTPYQMLDRARPWIAKEEKKFSDTLESLNMLKERMFHFKHRAPSLLSHLELLAHFIEAPVSENDKAEMEIKK